MNVQFYKPNAKNTGNAFGFRIGVKGKNDQEPCVYVTAIQQHSWNEKTKTGSFSANVSNPEKSISLKLNESELAGFIYAITNYTEFSAFHSFDDMKTAISLKPYTKANGGDAFSFSVSRNSASKFGIGLEMAEAYLLVEFFRYVLNELFLYRSNTHHES